MTERIRELAGDKNADGFKNYVKQNRKKLDLSKQCLQTPWSSPLDIFSKRAIRVATVLKPWASVAGDLGKHFTDERIRLAMSFQTKYLGMSPFHAPSLFTILAFLEYEHGIFHAKGGLGSITARMGEIAEEMGVKIHLNTPVKSLIYEGKTVTGVRIEGKEMFADKVVVNADFAHAMTTLVTRSTIIRTIKSMLPHPTKKIYETSRTIDSLGMTHLSTCKTPQLPMTPLLQKVTRPSTCLYQYLTNTRVLFGTTSRLTSVKQS
jgi:phytoene dehydrogenase-like protein